ncbi:peptidyl-tRNA hydrolase, partial [Candidatus Bathyarchaeota archaeon]|nr:peptidyl-tRNA hydrolase [Candidatus Bathyarchaeota archaeon]NIU81064.1 peptidyl-tRNA hydrolase [Candidatus Bathyarchaeota archaeon]NIV67715.1 peptidyl-tRNA hydrolase [Candidatus Bathyarchaeota archaeon]NIW16787.1 peptidyl-tRNA hydrolase [Candidatus Bathyarchaeota archaeon]NIW34327.1 peptidyl-tRNA hydrolase [Candidatus Bathyarchaeota archaeon]
MPEFRYKQVIVLRTDLKMSRGKLAAQAGHAAVSAAEEARKERPGWWRGWMEEGQCKIAVRTGSEEELLELEEEAKNLQLPSTLITD